MTPAEARVEKRPRRSLRRKLALGLLIDLVLILIIELSLHIFGVTFPTTKVRFNFLNDLDEEAQQSENILRPSEDLFWELRPGARDLVGRDSPNEQTFRGPSVPVEKPPGTFRVAVVGDSCTYGVNLEWRQTYGERLRQWLEADHPGQAFDLVNGGVHGYTLHQAALAMAKKILPLRPDLVILYLGTWNDHNPAIGATDEEKSRGPSGLAVLVDHTLSLLRRLRCVQGLEHVLRSRLHAGRRRQIVKSYLAGTYEGDPRVPLDPFEALLEGALENCSEIGARTILIIPELSPDLTRKHPAVPAVLDRYREATLRVAKRRQVPSVDLRPLFAGAGDTLFLDWVHPDGTGNLILARGLLELIEEQGWVSTAARQVPAEPARALHRPGISSDTSVVSLGNPGTLAVALDGGTGWANRDVVLVPGGRAARYRFNDTGHRFPLEVDPHAEGSLLPGPRKMVEVGLVDHTDDEGRAVFRVRLNRDLLDKLPHGILGLAARTVPDARKLTRRALTMPSQDEVTGDVWIRLEP